jgi:hypothetical protein
MNVGSPSRTGDGLDRPEVILAGKFGHESPAALKIPVPLSSIFRIGANWRPLNEGRNTRWKRTENLTASVDYVSTPVAILPFDATRASISTIVAAFCGSPTIPPANSISPGCSIARYFRL